MNEIRKGSIIIFEGEPYIVTDAQFLRKQQRRPVMRTTLKHLRAGRTKAHTFQQSDKVEEAAVERRELQFLYWQGEQSVFMDTSTYEQLELSAKAVGEMGVYLIEGQMAQVLFFEGNPLTVELPIKIERKVVEAPPGVRGDTSTNVMKEVTLEGGVKARVPLFIKEGDVVRIDTRSGEYVDRV